MLTKQKIAQTSSGEAIYLITLICGDYSAEILSLGAILRTLRTPDRKGQINDIVLGFDNPMEYLSSKAYFGQVVGRFANRIRNGVFTLENVEYQLEKNQNEHSLHSGSSNWGWRNWHVETYEMNGCPGVVLSLFSEDGDGGFPHAVNCTVSYLLSAHGELVVQYEATAAGPTPINLTNHSYFNLGGAASGTILNHELQLSCDRYLESDDANMVTGAILPVKGGPFDFSARKAVGTDIEEAGGYDHCFILEKVPSRLTEFAYVYEPNTGRTMKISTTLPAVQIYTGNSLDGTEMGKGSVQYQKYGGICFETQYYPDSPNHLQFPSCIFSKEHPFSHTTVFSFGVK